MGNSAWGVFGSHRARSGGFHRRFKCRFPPHSSQVLRFCVLFVGWLWCWLALGLHLCNLRNFDGAQAVDAYEVSLWRERER